jgi:hypothetical protein
MNEDLDKFKYVGNSDNWMDFRDMLVTHLRDCDNEYMFNKLLTGLILSIGGVDTLKATRKEMGLPDYTKEEEKSLKRLLDEKEKEEENNEEG